jgi:hypothetical protein
VLIVIAVVVFLAFLTVEYKFSVPMNQHEVVVQKITFTHLQMLGVLGVFKAKGTKLFNDAMSRPSEAMGGSLSSLLPIRCSLGGQVYRPFLLTLMLPPLFVVISGLMMFPAMLLKKWQRSRRLRNPVPPFVGRFGIPLKWARWKMCRHAMTREDIRAWGAEFRVASRWAAVTVFIMFSFYPALVKSIASIYNCTTPIEGKRYLVADFSVICYEGDHIGYLVVATIAGIVYAVGIPVAIAFATALKTPFVCLGAASGEEGPDGQGKAKKNKGHSSYWIREKCKRYKRTLAKRRRKSGVKRRRSSAGGEDSGSAPTTTRTAALQRHFTILSAKFQHKNDRSTNDEARSSSSASSDSEDSACGPAEASGAQPSSSSSSSASSASSFSSSSSSSSSSSESYSSSDSSDVMVDNSVDAERRRCFWPPRVVCARRHASKYVDFNRFLAALPLLLQRASF